MEMKKKYEFTGKTKVVRGVTVHQIRCNGMPEQYAEHEIVKLACKLNEASCSRVGKVYVPPDIEGGYIEKEENLSQTGSCWVSIGSVVLGDVVIEGDAEISGSIVYGNAKVSGLTKVIYSKISGDVEITDGAYVTDSILRDNVKITDGSTVIRSHLSGNVRISGRGYINNVIADDDVTILEDANIMGGESDRVIISGNTKICGSAKIRGEGIRIRDSYIGGSSKIGKRKCDIHKIRSIYLNDFSGVDIEIRKNGKYTGNMLPKYELLTDEPKVVKYEITGNEVTLYRIKALDNIRADVRAGDLGGWVANKQCLSQSGNCWVYDDSIVYLSGRVSGNAIVKQKSTVSNAKVKGNAVISDRSTVDGSVGHIVIDGDVVVTGMSKITVTKLSKTIKLSGNFVIDCGAVITRSLKKLDKFVISTFEKNDDVVLEHVDK